jgi:tagatose 1,6-diphosphate aldolase
MSAFKQQVIAALSPAASAVLLDPQVGAAQCIASGALPGHVVVVSVEASGYTGEPNARQSRVLPGWSVRQIKRLGASAVKLLVYYHPDALPAADIESLVAHVAADCAAHDIPFILEALSYSLDRTRKQLPSAERRHVVIETARRLVKPGVDAFKAEFPLDVAEETDVREWSAACAELSAACVTPWVLLSASVDYDTFLRQVTIACQAGASGVAVGRAVWKEAVGLAGSKRAEFVEHIACQRMRRITSLCDALARPWTDFYAPADVRADWYQKYGN